MNNAHAIVLGFHDGPSVEHVAGMLAPTAPDIGRTVRDGKSAALRRPADTPAAAGARA